MIYAVQVYNVPAHQFATYAKLEENIVQLRLGFMVGSRSVLLHCCDSAVDRTPRSFRALQTQNER